MTWGIYDLRFTIYAWILHFGLWLVRRSFSEGGTLDSVASDGARRPIVLVLVVVLDPVYHIKNFSVVLISIN
jgi:hypothetical protein